MFVSLGKQPGQSRVSVIQPHPPPSPKKKDAMYISRERKITLTFLYIT